MTIHSEWDLMCLADDIEPGDTLVIEHLKDEECFKLVIYTKTTDDNLWVLCKDENRREFIFNAESLEEKGKRTKQWRIVRKATVDMKFKPLE